MINKFSNDKRVPTNTPNCPNCNAHMVSRKSARGIFWGCSNFPNCKGTRDVMGESKQERERDDQAIWDRSDD